MLREPLSGLSMLCMFSVVIAMHLAMSVTFTAFGAAPQVAVNPSNQRVEAALTAAGVAVVSPPASGQNAEIQLADNQATIVLASSARPAWNTIWVGLRDAGYSGSAITVLDDSGDTKTDPLPTYLGVAALTGIASTVFLGLTVPLVGMRERGRLRQFGTTPLRRSTFLLAQVPARFAVAALEILVIVGLGVWRRYVDSVSVLSLTLSCVLGTAMLFAFALIFATRARNAESTQQAMVMLTLLLLFRRLWRRDADCDCRRPAWRCRA